MKPEGPAKHFILAFLLALVGYVLFYQSIEHRRTRKGPWQVTFIPSAAGAPAIVINQPKLGITNVQIRFAGAPTSATNRPVTLTFGQPRPVPFEVSFGKCIFMDTTFLPGTVVFELFDHEVELLPRVLVIDAQERAWQPDGTLTLQPAGSARKLAHP
jgi:hypothetical protein